MIKTFGCSASKCFSSEYALGANAVTSKRPNEIVRKQPSRHGDFEFRFVTFICFPDCSRSERIAYCRADFSLIECNELIFFDFNTIAFPIESRETDAIRYLW